MTNHLLTDNMSEPLNGATSATVEINSGTGHLTIDRLPEAESVLASGTLQYLENQGSPSRSLGMDHGQATLVVRGQDIGRPWFRFPWEACYGATEWQIHLNPTVLSNIIAHTGGGNVKLNLADMAVSHVAADTGGGSLDVILPEKAANLAVVARTGGGNVSVEVGDDITGGHILEATSGAGNVVVRLPNDVPARIHATSGLGKVAVESRFGKVDSATFESSEYDGAVDRIDITLKSGAGNVTVMTR